MRHDDVDVAEVEAGHLGRTARLLLLLIMIKLIIIRRRRRMIIMLIMITVSMNNDIINSIVAEVEAGHLGPVHMHAVDAILLS